MEPPVGTMALLSTDVEGSTRLVVELGVAWREVLSEHHQSKRLTVNDPASRAAILDVVGAVSR